MKTVANSLQTESIPKASRLVMSCFNAKEVRRRVSGAVIDVED